MTKATTPKTRLAAIADTVGKKRDGSYRATAGYFYRHGRSAEKFKADIQAAIPEAEIIDSGDHFGAWPSRSYFWCTFRLPAPRLTGLEEQFAEAFGAETMKALGAEE